MDVFEVSIGRARTAQGYEWFLLVNGERVQTNEYRTGLFTGRDAKPENVLPRLLERLPRGDTPCG